MTSSLDHQGYAKERGWTETSFACYRPDEDAYFTAELGAIGLLPGAFSKVLDIGFGNGSFMAWCRDRGVLCHGLEANPYLIDRATEHGFTAASDIRELCKSAAGTSYDLITAFDVLEHIGRDALVDFLRSAREVARAETLLLCRFPNGDNPFSMPIQNGDLTHVTSIGSAMALQLAQLSGWEALQLREPSQPKRRLGLKRAVVALGLPLRHAIGMVFRHLFMGGQPIKFSANLLLVMRPASASATESA